MASSLPTCGYSKAEIYPIYKKKKITRGEINMKDITKILRANPDLIKEVAKLLKEDLETDLTVVDKSAGDNSGEVVPEAPATKDIDNAEVLGDGHSVVDELTSVKPTDTIATESTPEDIDKTIDELPAAELEGEVESLEEKKSEDAKEVEELDKVIKEATELRNEIKERIVFTESVINKVNARILTEAAILLRKASLNETKK